MTQHFQTRTVGITGNIAAGKSTVQHIFEQNGIPCIDVDTVVADLYLSDTQLITDVKKLFESYGITTLQNDSFIDKSKIRTVVFQNKEIRKSLEHIVHPAVQKAVDNFVADNKNAPFVGIFIPLLFETNGMSKYDYVTLLTINPEEQLKRLLSRNSFLTQETAKERIHSQMPQFLKESRADFIIDNSGDLQSTQQQALTVLQKLSGQFSPENKDLFIGIPYLRHKWMTTMNALHIPENAAKIGFNRFLTAYDNNARNYHGIKHVEKMLKEIEGFNQANPNRLQHLDLLNYGVFMHDYINGRPNDVRDSAEIAAQFLNLSTSAEIRNQKELVSKIITATDHSQSEDKKSLEEQVIIDADLVILGEQKGVYDLYARQIRAEYAQYPDDAFAKGRTAVLRTFLDKPSIYGTEYFHQKFEVTARNNLTREIKSLAKQNQSVIAQIRDNAAHTR